MIAAVLVDYRNVLVKVAGTRMEQVVSIVGELGGDKELVPKLFASGHNGAKLSEALDMGHVKLADLVDKLKSVCGVGPELTPEGFLGMYHRYRTPGSDAIAAIKEIRNQGLVTVGYSDCGEAESIIASRIFCKSRFEMHGHIESWREKTRKPGLLEIALAYLADSWNIVARECALIDDDPANLEFARKRGVTPVLYHNQYHDRATLTQQLRAAALL